MVSSFVYDVVCQIHSIVIDVSKEAGVKARCNALAAALANVKQYLEDSELSLDDERTRKLLSNLERICIVRDFISKTGHH